MIVGRDGVRTPRLRLWDVVRRGALYGAGAAAVLCLGAFFVVDPDDRAALLGAVGFLALVTGGFFLAGGLFFWLCSRDDIRRWRDWRTVRSQSDAVTVFAPGCVRFAVAELVIAPAALGLADLIDRASYNSWLNS
ncbi:DUF6336 family protein [Streptomyces sp. WM6386]|uniref:DUF6336 family protein n=1 Tax=Streptomyces sp. WM6386 TaxID=1415558 RepID=UPI0006194D77|nr:DUF6336 family protein [Streptomyces sp. WM6386]KKD07828.1 hypothetical protein TN53_11725 [Streptomyces sp. WM6386]